MITEDYCSFEISKLLKEKGFDWPVQCTYDEYGVVSERWTEYSDNYTIRHWQTPCVTHQMALKWLREVHRIFIIIDYVVLNKSFYQYTYEIHNMRKGRSMAVSAFRDDYETYEEAVEAAIKYCLTNLI